jgi:hypothetical protein
VKSFHVGLKIVLTSQTAFNRSVAFLLVIRASDKESHFTAVGWGYLPVYTNTTPDTPEREKRHAGRLPSICDLGFRFFMVRSCAWSGVVFVYTVFCAVTLNTPPAPPTGHRRNVWGTAGGHEAASNWSNNRYC